MLYIAKYLTRLLKHKWFVFIECCKLGIPWIGVVHDLSKFTPIELKWYAEKYRGNEFPLAQSMFKRAMLHHYHWNKHHPWYWVLYGKPVQMPIKYMVEMVADWRAMAREFGGSASEWYAEHGAGLPLHDSTRNEVEQILNALDSLD